MQIPILGIPVSNSPPPSPATAARHGMLLKTMQVDYNYTGDEQAQGLAKLVEAATVYDATGPACLGLGAFQVSGPSIAPGRAVIVSVARFGVRESASHRWDQPWWQCAE